MNVKRQIEEWDKNIRCLPTFEEIRDVEYIRQSGKLNMVTDDVAAALAKNRLKDGLNWIVRCRQFDISWFYLYSQSISYMETIHGDRENWFDKKNT